MKKLYNSSIILILILLSSIKSHAQLASGMPHTFTVGASAAFSVGTPTNILPAGALADESMNLISPAGWTFTFAGVAHNRVGISTNGWACLVPTAWAGIPALPGPLPANQLNNNTTGFPIVAPCWDDLSTAIISWIVPSANVLWIRWSCKWDRLNATTSSLFYIKLDGNTNTITYYYPSLAYTPTSPSASIGIAGICPGDFYSVSPTSATTATVDNVTENAAVGTGAANCFRPNNVSYLFTPVSLNDNCATATDFLSGGPITGTCTNFTSSTFNAVTSGSGMSCAAADVKDVWFKYVKPAGFTSFTVATSPASCNSVTGTSVEVWSACGGTNLGCATTSVANPNYGQVTISRPCSTETLFVRVTSDSDIPGKFQICASGSNAVAPGSGTTCANATPICGLPYTQTGLTTAGSIDNYDSTSSICHTLYMNGEDYVFSYTPAVSGCIHVSATTPNNNMGVFVYSGCPNAGGTYCLGSAEVPTGNAVINSVALTGGQTYYIVVDNDTALGNLNLASFDISVTSLGGAQVYDACASAHDFLTINNTVNCSPYTMTTECSTPTPVGQAGVPSCVPAHNPPYFIDGVTGDVWARFTAVFTGSLQISTFQSAVNPTSNAAMAIYTGTCGAFGAPYACDYNSGANGMPSLSIPVVNGTTYYIRIWSEHPENQGNFDICFQSACSPPNDLPCASVFVPLGGIAAGFNTCAGSTGEPANAAQCVVGGTINTVWYSAIVPASGQVRVRTHPLTLTDTQIQGFTISGGCTNATIPASVTARTCNDDGTACSGGFSDFSDVTYTGLFAGDTLFVAVDGVNSLTGSFEITFTDGSSPILPPVYQQDCGAAQVLCSSTDVVIADPGWRNNGNICDLPNPVSCWGVGERNSVWYQFTVDPALTGGTATLSFDILSASSTDLDILVWDITSNPSTACASIQTGAISPVACNYAAAGSATGLSPGGTGYYSPSIVFSGAPRTYILLVNGFNSAANAGYTLHWPGSPPPISSSPSTSIWSGFTNTLFSTATNWGECGTTPSCSIDATIGLTANGRQPSVIGVQSVRNITINAGATLTITPGSTLNVCGNFANFGNLVCGAGSTIAFIGGSATAQTISGALTGSDAFANLVITKPAGSVQLLSNIDVTENFTTSSATSVFNINGKYMKVAGNFTNSSGLTTFTNTGANTVEFNGTLNQNFINSSGSISINRVTMNKASGRLLLSGANSIMNIDTCLTLTAGIIDTRSLAALEVNIKYFSPTLAVSGGNATSFVDGKLRRKIANPAGPSSPPLPAAYNFPVGLLANYENALITFTSSTLVDNLLSTFTAWPALPPPMGPTSMECVIANYGNLQLFNHGYWSFARTGGAFNGAYNVALNNTAQTNNTGLGWTVVKADIASIPSTTAQWSLLGTCVPASTAANTQRTGLNSPAALITSFNMHFTTAQSDQPLPIELLYFNAEPDGEDVICKWETASETNNDYFEVERSSDGKKFETLPESRTNGYGNGISTSARKYSFIDHDRCDDIRYYRLKQFDIDGRNSISEPVAINCKSNSIELYPNPANNTITYQFKQAGNTELTVKILDISGRVVRLEKINVQKGMNSVTTNIDDLASGAYYLRIIGTDYDDILQTQFFKN